MSDAQIPETTIVVRAFNEERWLPETLAAIRSQRYRDFEILLVDSGSVDRTREIATGFGARVVRLRSEDFTFGHSLNVGIQEARGNLIAIISAHCIPTDENWLATLVAPLRAADIAMVYGGQRGHAVSRFSEARDFERVFGSTSKRLSPPNYFANNANSAVRRDLWLTHGFDEGLPGLEDIEWAKYWMDRGKAVLYEANACVHHIHEESWAQVRHRYHREGIAARWVGIRRARDVVSEIGREVRWCANDLWRAAREGRLTALGREIVRFRFEKTVGTVGGILDAANITNPAARAAMYFEKSFPAVVIRGPHDAVVEQRTVPTLRPGELLIRVAYEGICATDLEILDGSLGYYKSGMAKYPITPGHECSGTVAAVGTKVTGFAEGDRVVIECIQGCGECAECAKDNAISCSERREVGVIGHDGGYAAYVVTRARYAHLVPDEVTLAQAALAEPLAVVLKALRRLGGSADGGTKRCAVVGAGTIGHLAARVLAARGHDVTIFDREPRRVASLAGAMRTSTALRGLDQFDWLIEATGVQDALETMLQHSATGATLLLLGLPYARREFSFESIVGFDRTVIGSVGSSGRDFDEALRTLASLDTAPFLESTHELADFQAAWADARSKTHLKVMLKIDSTAN